ncbi:uncharacterized protein LOC109596169 [Aethina tumida]|uniref:uncharacterized protein LOC109596169 n=1 Tax=Aethina tumida TaxID=116153 RepID=UPI0021483E82|nr:uncharacterized protein LOC109596169 [Aethina tumida]
MMGANGLVFLGCFVGVFATVLALQCYQCGQYNDGVGSITPCINETYMRLKDCPHKDHAYCIKYISEGSIVKDCVAKCTDREDWGTRTLCCTEDACNSTPHIKSSTFPIILCLVVLALGYRH